MLIFKLHKVHEQTRKSVRNKKRKNKKTQEKTNPYLQPMVVCKKVTMPVTKIIVEIMWLRAGSSSAIQRAGVRINGMDTMAPIIVK
jgi:hypothetical protein